jgi:hypothetical protein
VPSHRLGFAVVAVVSGCLLFAALPAAAGPAQIEVTTCGQQIPPGRTAFLSADLACPTFDGSVGVALGNGGKLDLRGFTLTGGDAAVTCGKITFVGPAGLPPKGGGRCEVFGGTITGARYEAIVGSNVVVRNVTIVDNLVYAVLAFHKASVYDSHIGNSSNGVQANVRILLKNSSFANAFVNSGRVVRLESSSVTGGGSFGVYGSRITLVASSVTENGTDADCGQAGHVCADVVSDHVPVLDAASTCGHSVKQQTLGGGDTPVSWGVCTLD